MASGASNEVDREIVVSRIIEGPRRLVFEAFTSATHLAEWCAPWPGSKITTHAFDFKPGGVWDATIQGLRWEGLSEPLGVDGDRAAGAHRLDVFAEEGRPERSEDDPHARRAWQHDRGDTAIALRQ